MEMKIKHSKKVKTSGELKAKKNLKSKILFLLLKLLSLSKEKMARYAYKNTKFYKEIYDRKFGKKNITKSNFKNLPLIKKDDLSDYSPFDLLSEKLKSKVYRYAETTGSTGTPTPSFFTKKEFFGSVVLSGITPFTAYLKKIIKDNRRAVCGLARGFTIAGDSFHQILDRTGFLTINVDARTTISPPHRVAKLLTKFKPSIIVASEADFLSWMRVLKEEYTESYTEVVDNLKAVISTAELCSKERSDSIQNYFKIIHIDTYACVEGFFSVPCPCGEKHILPIYHTEVLSPDLACTKEFGRGRFAFTNLVRKSTPLVRYMLDDLVTILPANCSYGFTKSIIPHGRYEMSVVINNKIYNVRDFEEILFRDYLFGEYQIQINNDNILIILEDYQEEEIPNRIIKNELEDKFEMDIDLRFCEYGTIRDYRKIRDTKPLFRLIDNRTISTQKIAVYT